MCVFKVYDLDELGYGILLFFSFFNVCQFVGVSIGEVLGFPA